LYHKELVNTHVRLRGTKKDRKGPVFDVFSDVLKRDFYIFIIEHMMPAVSAKKKRAKLLRSISLHPVIFFFVHATHFCTIVSRKVKALLESGAKNPTPRPWHAAAFTAV
jgi:hypothetical protein